MNVIKGMTFTAQDPPHRRPKTPLNVIKGTLQNAALPANVIDGLTFAGSAAFHSAGAEAGGGGSRVVHPWPSSLQP